MVNNLLNNYSYSGDKEAVEIQVKENTSIVFNEQYPEDPLINLDVLNQVPTFEGNYSDLDYENYREILSQIHLTDPAKGGGNCKLY